MIRTLCILLLLFLLPGCTELEFVSHITKNKTQPQTEGTFKVGNPYQVEGEWYYPKEQYEYSETGIASWYGPGFDGHRTASGEIFDTSELTAAHRTLQMPSLVRVTNLDNGRSLIVRVNDRGPFKRGRVMDVSPRAAELLGFKGIGTARVRLDLLPQESMQIAQAARSGLSTRGYEVAANEGKYAFAVQPPQTPSAVAAPALTPGYQVAALQGNTSASLQPVTATPLAGEGVPAPNTNVSAIVPGHTRNGNFYPDPVVTEMPVRPSSIYVQAGAFSQYANAQRLSASLQAYGPVSIKTVTVNGAQFFRVRVGPSPSVDAADALLARVVAGGQKQAIIVVDEHA